MERGWLWALAIGLVITGGAWNAYAGLPYDLTKLKSVCVAGAVISPEAVEDLGLDRVAIWNHILVSLEDKLPKLRVVRFAGIPKGPCARTAPQLVVIVDLDATNGKGGYYGHVSILLYRWTRWKSGKVGRGIAYYDGRIITGPVDLVEKEVKATLDKLLADFAAEYYKGGKITGSVP